MPEPLTALFSAAHCDLSPEQIRVKCEETFQQLKTKLKSDQCEKLDQVTRQQTKSTAWDLHRAGRITGTKFYRVTTPDTLSASTLQSVMEYNQGALNVPAIVWGREMEDRAQQDYAAHMAQNTQTLQHQSQWASCAALRATSGIVPRWDHHMRLLL